MAKMTVNEMKFEIAKTVLQPLVELTGGRISENFPKQAVKESFRIADAFVEYYVEHYKDV